MLKVSAEQFIKLGREVQEIWTILYMASSELPDSPQRRLDDNEIEQYRQHLAQVERIASDLGLITTPALIRPRLHDVPTTTEALDILIEAMRVELRDNLFLFVPHHLAPFYENDAVLSAVAAAAFPSAVSELRAAGNCLAAGLDTACVFHAMRAAEIGLRALARALGVSFSFGLDLAQWNEMLVQIEKKVRDMGERPKSSEKDGDLEFYSQACAQLRYFKDCWRVRVAHARASYDEAQARSLLRQTTEFFEILARRLNELAA